MNKGVIYRLAVLLDLLQDDSKSACADNPRDCPAGILAKNSKMLTNLLI
ncbi:MULTISPECIES: hypothetical protein [Nitrosomonas]|nr:MULTISPECIES: hypothetical protein [Nitrosomonas]